MSQISSEKKIVLNFIDNFDFVQLDIVLKIVNNKKLERYLF